MRRPVLLSAALVAVACNADESGRAGSAGAGGTITTSTGGHHSGGEASGGSSMGGGTASGGSGGMQAACPAVALSPGEHAASIEFDGKSRDYEVQVPGSYDNTAAIPVVFDLHGLGSNANQQQFISGWQSVAEANGFAVVRPQGYGALPSWNGGDTCCGEALAQHLDDVGLMKAIVIELTTQLCVDPKRVYATGISNGGAMSHRLACDAADVFAAVAPVAYPIAYLPISKCQPSRPIAVMHSHGTNDTTVPYNGAYGIASAPASFAQWAAIDGCSGTPVETYAQGDSHCDTFQSCQEGVEVSLCTILGPHLLYSNSDNVPIAEIAWQFFAQHPLP